MHPEVDPAYPMRGFPPIQAMIIVHIAKTTCGQPFYRAELWPRNARQSAWFWFKWDAAWNWSPYSALHYNTSLQGSQFSDDVGVVWYLAWHGGDAARHSCGPLRV